MRSLIPTLLLLIAVAAPVTAECPCIPLTHVWIVKTCADWNCASTELILAHGDPQVIAMPVGMDDGRWLIVQRLSVGSAINVGDDPFELNQFDTMDGAVSHFAACARDRHPMMLTAPDGQVLVIALKQPEARRRAVAH